MSRVVFRVFRIRSRLFHCGVLHMYKCFKNATRWKMITCYSYIVRQLINFQVQQENFNNFHKRVISIGIFQKNAVKQIKIHEKMSKLSNKIFNDSMKACLSLKFLSLEQYFHWSYPGVACDLWNRWGTKKLTPPRYNFIF